MNKKVVSIVGVLLIASPTLVFAQSTNVQAQLNAILAQIQQLQAQLTKLRATGTPSTARAHCVTLSHNLIPGDTDADNGGDVTKLQQFLIAGGYLSGSASGVVDPKTVGAVQRFQAAKGIASSGTPGSTGYGAVGPRTIAAMRLCQEASEKVTDESTTEISASGISRSSIECALGGETLRDGEATIFYSSPTDFPLEPCSSKAQLRHCEQGVLSGSSDYQYATCSRTSTTIQIPTNVTTTTSELPPDERVFGGVVRNSIYCSCTRNYWIDVGPPRSARVLFTPSFSTLYRLSNVTTIGVFLNGKYVRAGACLTGALCVEIPSDGTMIVTGTSR